MVDRISLHLVENLERIAHSLGQIAKHLVHFLAGFKPLLLRVEHTRGVV